MIKIALDKITAQQPKQHTAVWMVGQQLKDICRMEPTCAELIAQDLDNPEMTLEKAEKQIKAYADKHQKNGFACVTPEISDKILREFYGLPQSTASEHRPVKLSTPIKSANAPALSLNLDDFL